MRQPLSFSSSGYNYGTGYYFGRDSSGGLIILDTWKRGNDRTNKNMVIMGVVGVENSTAVTHIALSEEELVASKKRGNALLMISSKRFHVVFEIPKYKFEYMVNGGRR